MNRTGSWKFAAVAGIAMLSLPEMALAHGDGRVEVELDSPSHMVAGEVTLEFELVDDEQEIVLTDAELAITHEKKLHMFVFDEALKEFHHLHPEFHDGRWKTSVTLPTDGNYKLWAQGQIESDGAEFSAYEEFSVSQGQAANPTPVVLTDLRSGEDRVSVAKLSGQEFRAGHMAMPTLSFSRSDGTAPIITPYLGATAHVVAVSADGKKLIHVHPMDHGGQFMLHMEFSEAGFYRLWVQFVDHDELKTVPLSVEVLPSEQK